MSGHDRSRVAPPADDGEEEDLVDTLLRRTGCMEHHYAVQACMAESGDWRRCQDRVTEFRQCMENYHRRNREGDAVEGSGKDDKEAKKT